MNIKRAMALAGLLGTGMLASAPAAALDLTCGGLCSWVTYGDGKSFLLQYNAYIYDKFINSGSVVGPGNPYYIDSTPGAIKDLTVIGTGTSSNPATTNTSGMDDAYPTPNSSGIPYFSTGTTADPNGAGEFTGDGAGTWDVSLDALKSFMGTDNSLIFFFNNNQIKSGGAVNEGLAGWAQITLRDAAGVLLGTYDLTNQGGKFATIADGGGGTLNGNPTYTHAGALDNPLIGTNAATDYILSGGKQCLDTNGALISCTADPSKVAKTFDANLGANQAAYAIVFPGLDQQLLALFSRQHHRLQHERQPAHGLRSGHRRSSRLHGPFAQQRLRTDLPVDRQQPQIGSYLNGFLTGFSYYLGPIVLTLLIVYFVKKYILNRG